jgi:DNA polymerase-3 subunit chi
LTPRPAAHGAVSYSGAMTEVLFYHLQNERIENVLPALLEKSIARGWRVIVQAATDERVDVLDAHLWTFRDDSFLPHGTDREATAAEQTVLLTTRDDNPNAANVRFLIEGALLPAEMASYQRVVLLFDGHDSDAVASARAQWTTAKAQGHETTYWQPDEHGRWQQKG